jgi:hypothetical protein
VDGSLGVLGRGVDGEQTQGCWASIDDYIVSASIPLVGFTTAIALHYNCQRTRNSTHNYV